MKLGFIKPLYNSEKRVALLPKDVKNFKNELYIEKGFGLSLGIEDQEYEQAGCVVLSKKEVFDACDAIFSLKLIQPEEYEYIREGQVIVGWTHPLGSGKKFMEEQAVPKKLVIVDLDNIYPSVYYNNQVKAIDWLPKNFVYKNSVIAGYSATLHALMTYGLAPDSRTKVAVLSSGNVAQGAFNIMSKLGAEVRMYYRNTMNEFKEKISDYDIIINGIEVSQTEPPIINKEEIKKLKKGCLIIDAAADAGNAIEGTRFTTLDEPVYSEDGIFYYEVTNAPSLFYRNASENISEAFSKYVYKDDISKFVNLMK